MVSKDFKDYQILHIKEKDITSSGADLADINLFFIIALDKFFGTLFVEYGIHAVILFNGLTTGNHKSFTHKRGLAGDIAFAVSASEMSIYSIWKKAIEAGFKGIGLYWNGVAYSMHLDLRPSLAFWSMRKDETGAWISDSVFKDPREIKI